MTRTRMSGLVCVPLVICTLLTGCDSGPESRTSEETAGQYTLNTETYREDIETVEAVLYQNVQPAASDLDRLSGAIFQLGSKALAQEEHPLRKEKARLIMTLASRGDLSGPGVTPATDLDRLREEWETLRETAFHNSDWQRDRTDYTDPAGTTFTVTDGEIHAFNFVLDRLTSLVEQGRWEVEALMADLAASPAASTGEDIHFTGWQKWAGEWEKRIQAALAGLPVCPPHHDGSDYLQAHESLARAVAELRMVPEGSSGQTLPERFQWERRFDRAEIELADTRGYLDRCD